MVVAALGGRVHLGAAHCHSTVSPSFTVVSQTPP